MEASTPAPPPPPPPPPTAASAAIRFGVEAQRQDEYNRFLPLVKWLLAMPHYLVLLFLVIGVVLRRARGLLRGPVHRPLPARAVRLRHRRPALGMPRDRLRLLLTDEYPPFSLEDEPDYPAGWRSTIPSRRRPLAAAGALAPDHPVRCSSPGSSSPLAGLVAFIGVFVILFTEELPEGMFNLILIPCGGSSGQRLRALLGHAVPAVRLGRLRGVAAGSGP